MPTCFFNFFQIKKFPKVFEFLVGAAGAAPGASSQIVVVCSFKTKMINHGATEANIWHAHLVIVSK